MRSQLALWLVTVNEACCADYWFRKWGWHRDCVCCGNKLKSTVLVFFFFFFNGRRRRCNLNNVKYLIRHSGGLRPVEVIHYLLWVCMIFLGAANKQMVDLTYLCFVFLNDRSGAWWEIQWAACQRRNNSLESPPKPCVCALLRSVCLSRPPPSLSILYYYWLWQEQLFQSGVPLCINNFPLVISTRKCGPVMKLM